MPDKKDMYLSDKMNESTGSLKSPLSPATFSDETMILSVQQFLDDWSYRIMQSSLGKTWPLSKVNASALEVLSLNGVPLSKQDIDYLSKMEEAYMIREVVARMPMDSRQTFENIALQVQLLVTMTTRIRKSVDEGNEGKIGDALQETDSTGVGQEVLKQAVIHASKEASALQKCNFSWKNSMEIRLDRLQRSAEMAEHSQQQLLAIEAQLEQYGNKHSGKAKACLVNFAVATDQALMHTVFSAWLGSLMQFKADQVIRERFQKELDDYKATLFECKERQLANVKSVLMRGARSSDGGLLRQVIQWWLQQVEENKKGGSCAEELRELEAKFAAYKKTHKNNSTAVMTRFSSFSDEAVLQLYLIRWIEFSEEYKKVKDYEDVVKKAEMHFHAWMSKKKGNATSVIHSINAWGEGGIMHLYFMTWLASLADDRKVQQLENAMQTGDCRLKQLLDGQAGTRRGVQTRINDQIEENLLLRCFSVWALDYKVYTVDKYFKKKMDGKRAQLHKVQELFKSFAAQLDKGLGDLDGDSSDRTYERSGRRNKLSKRGKGDNKETMSLPNIHERPGYGQPGALPNIDGRSGYGAYPTNQVF